MLSLSLLVKLAASPALIGLASLAGKRWGPQVAGMLGGLPLVGGPVVVVLWLTVDGAYAAQVAAAAPAGVWANIAYMLTFGWVSAHAGWPLALLASWLCYLGSGLVLHALGLGNSLWLGLAVLPGLWLSTRLLLPRPARPPRSVPLPPIELLARMATAALLVLTLTGLSTQLGPTLTGIFSGAPISATVIPAFTFATAGRDALLLALRGFLTGLMGFAVFFLLLSQTLLALGAPALLLALAAGLLVGGAATWLARHRA